VNTWTIVVLVALAVVAVVIAREVWLTERARRRSARPVFGEDELEKLLDGVPEEKKGAIRAMMRAQEAEMRGEPRGQFARLARPILRPAHQRLVQTSAPGDAEQLLATLAELGWLEADPATDGDATMEVEIGGQEYTLTRPGKWFSKDDLDPDVREAFDSGEMTADQMARLLKMGQGDA
jgi:hypothetical protein